jgi:hypothetical protein
MRTWLVLAFAEVARFLGVTFYRFGTLYMEGSGGGISRSLLVGYVLTCMVAIIAACWFLGDRRPARFAMAALVALGIFNLAGVSVILLALYLLDPFAAQWSAMGFLVAVWALFCVCSLGTAFFALWLSTRAWRETPAVPTDGAPA